MCTSLTSTDLMQNARVKITWEWNHMMSFKIIGNSTVCSTYYADLRQRNHQSFALLWFEVFPLVNPLTKGQYSRAPSQYPKRRLFVRSRKISKPRDLYLDLSDRSEIWQALRQQCACQISKRYDNLKYRSRGFETSRDLTKDVFSDIETGPRKRVHAMTSPCVS